MREIALNTVFQDSENPLKVAMRVREEHESLIRGSLDIMGSESDDEEDVLIGDESPKGKSLSSKLLESKIF